MDLMHVCPGPDGTAWAIGLAVVALVVVGLPMAALGLLLSAITSRQEYGWPADWGYVFRAAFVVQVSSVVVIAPVCLAVALSATLGGDAWETMVAMVLAGGLVAGVFAVRSWHRLMNSVVPDAPLSISGAVTGIDDCQ
jgi:hypothetical protein